MASELEAMVWGEEDLEVSHMSNDEIRYILCIIHTSTGSAVEPRMKMKCRFIIQCVCV